MKKLLVCLLILFGNLFAGITETHYSNGVGIDAQLFIGSIDHTVSPVGGYPQPANKTWLQYFESSNNGPTSIFRFAVSYNKSLLSFLAIEAGISIVYTDEEEYSRYSNFTDQRLAVNYFDMPFFAGLTFRYRFSKLFDVFITPAFELNEQILSYTYTATPPMSSEINRNQTKNQIKPAFDVRGGVEFIPGGKIFGVAMLLMYRDYSAEATDISVVSNAEFNEKIVYAPFALGVKCSFYFPKKK
jgi:hypothetical protein